MKELHNQLLAATDPIEIIEISDKILTERLRRYIKHTFLKGESLLSLGKFDEALSIFEQILEYNEILLSFHLNKFRASGNSTPASSASRNSLKA